jgi:hypothetical protein
MLAKRRPDIACGLVTQRPVLLDDTPGQAQPPGLGQRALL